MNMSSGISPENERFIDEAVATGLFEDRGQVLDTALELLKRRQQLIRDVNIGIEQLERGDRRPMDIAAILDQVGSRLAQAGR
jgi:Arc/MetJ-type ribon-helix-helix transcriptional regulator